MIILKYCKRENGDNYRKVLCEMSLQYTFLSENANMKGTRLQICSDEKRSVSVLQYKAQGCLLYSHEKGMYSEDKKRQVKRIHEFLKIADSHGIDLVVTPEATVPLDIVREIIDGNEVRPERGKLWCLGVEGISKQDYKLMIDEWGKRQDIAFVYPQTINMCKHINALFYFFQTIDNKLAVVLQAKTGAMRDVSFSHEQADLSTGEEIFILDLNGTDVAQNVVATLICADILNINCADFCSKFHGKSPVILNIQMNPKPFHERIIGFRRTFFEDNDMRNAQIIVANWGRGTTIHVEGTNNEDTGYSDSGSTIYFSLGNNHWQNSINSIFENREFVINGIGENQKFGLEYFLTRQYEIWKIQEEIQVVYYEKKVGNSKSFERDAMGRQFFPFIVQKYRYNDENNLEEDKENHCDCNEMTEILNIFKHRASDDIKKCANKKCEECTRFYAEVLISWCLGEKISDEFLVENGKAHRTVQALYQDDKDTVKKAYLKKLMHGVETIPFPERFGEFNESQDFSFEIDHDAAERGGNNKYNLVLKCNKSGYKRLLVIFLGDMDIGDVRRRYTEIKKSVHIDRQDNILIYYVDMDGIHIYAEPYEQESILVHNADFSADIESIK